jgi:hypothetical protein
LPEKTDFEWLPLDQVKSASALAGIAIWRALRGTRRFPARSDVTPREITGIMQHISLIKVINGGEDFENRFVGDAVVRAHDVPIAHRRFSEVARDIPRLIEQLLPMARKVVATGEPLAYCGKTGHDMAEVAYTDFEGVLLPLGPTDEMVDHILYVGTCSIQVLPS